MLSSSFVDILGIIASIVFITTLIITAASNNRSMLQVAIIAMYTTLGICFAVGLIFWCGTLIGLGVIFVALLTLFSHVF